MTIGQHQVVATTDAPSTESTARPSSVPPPWSMLWQVPVALASVAVIVGAVLHAKSRAPGHDFDGALGQVSSLAAEGRLDMAAQQLRDMVLPHLHEATGPQQAWAKALAGDLIWLAAQQRGVVSRDDCQLLHERYEEAEALKWSFTPVQVERWSVALVTLGDLAGARRRLSLLGEGASSSDHEAEREGVRVRVLRLVAKAALDRPGLGLEEQIQALHTYRAGAIGAADIVWAIVRQAELRLEHGLARQAMDHLQVDLRRAESQIEAEAVPLGEVFATLARGYLELGDTDFAESQVAQALATLDANDPARMGALVTLGRIRVARGLHEEALESFTEAAEIDPAGDAWAAAMLGRADMLGVLGRHEEAQQAYRRLAEGMSKRSFGWGITVEVAAERLNDRHDAALATRQFDVALAYIELASAFFAADRVPEPVLRRLASTNRVLADGWMARSMDEAGEVIDQSARIEAGKTYRRAAQAFLARAKHLHASPTQEAAWAESIWQAADCFDLAGHHEEAIRQFETFVRSRSEEDPRWLDATWRLARCRQAVGDLRGAAALYEEIIRSNPTSLVAARSHVPLAACYVGLGTPSLAEQQLLRVISGGEPLRPAASDYQNALAALGALYHETGEYARAIEMLEKAVGYAGEGARLAEVRFRLADSYRLGARRLAETASTGQAGGERSADAVAAGAIASRTVMRRDHLARAAQLFEQVIESSEAIGAPRLGETGRVQLRLAHLYVADCAYELGDYQRAIELYDRAAQRYADHPSSVTALIQIVNAYMRLGDRARALAAHNRVLHKLEQMPESVLAGDEAVLDEAAWRSWLELVPPGGARRAGVNEP